MARNKLTLGDCRDLALQLYLTVLPTSYISISGVVMVTSIVGGKGSGLTVYGGGVSGPKHINT